jgi:hypothetical protein
MARSVEKRATRSLSSNFYLFDLQSFIGLSRQVPVHNFALSSTLPKFSETCF